MLNSFFFSFSLESLINDGIYNLIHKHLFLICKNKTFIVSKSSIAEINSNFRIKKQSNKIDEAYYYIGHLKTNYTLILQNKTKNTEEYFLWTFIQLNNNNYIIKNKNNCYIKVREFNINCENITLKQASKFKLEKIYEEIKINKTEYELIEKEPIDILIKYIDLRDPNLKRRGIHQIKKDFDNEELRYSIRSILKNIPWVRKIFILMPNEKVRYFKDYDLIKEKIIYVKDKDLLGYDSSNSYAFQYRYWEMKKFGISDNFIIMDDDYFIGSPLKKSDFFYVENNKVVPAIITSNFKFINEKYATKMYNIYKNKINKTNNEQTGDIFVYTQCTTYLFLIKLFKKSIIIPDFTHNAIPVNIKELKEAFDLINNSEYKYFTLDSLYRHKNSIQFQTFLLSYIFNKYNKKVRHVSYKFIDNKDSVMNNYHYSLFCINTGSFNDLDIYFLKTKIVMEYLFPIPTPYEIYNYSFSSTAFKVMKYMQKIINNKTNQYKCDNLSNNNIKNYYKNRKTKKLIYIIYILLLIFIIFIKLIFKLKYEYSIQ